MRESWAPLPLFESRDVLEQPLEVVEDHERQGTLVGVVEDARDRHRLARLGDAHEALGGDELDERELGLQRDRRGQRGLAGARRALEEDGKERGALRAFELADEAVRALEQLR